MYFSAADVCVLPYKSATQSGVVTQAFCASRPVVATRVAGLAEMVNDGVEGFLADVDDDEALAERCATLLSNPELAQRLGDSAQSRFRADWSSESMARHALRIYRAVGFEVAPR